jgi:hypothetical protein
MYILVKIVAWASVALFGLWLLMCVASGFILLYWLSQWAAA